jgi:Gas vesicle protein
VSAAQRPRGDPGTERPLADGRASGPPGRRHGHSGPPGAAVGDVALVDLVDRLLTGGVVLAGDVTLSLAGVDLVHVSVRALISAVETIESGGSPR